VKGMRGHLFLPRGVEPPSGFRPYDGLERPVVGICRTPVEITPEGEIRECQARAYSQAELESHAVKCAAEHHDTIVAVVRKAKPEIGKPWDPERAAWAKENGAAIYRGEKHVYGGSPA
jgi:hypothetical protein